MKFYLFLKKVAKEEVEKKVDKFITYLDCWSNERVHQEIFKMLQIIDSSIHQEGELLNQRLNLFLLAQTFLLSAYIQSLTLKSLTIVVVKILAAGVGLTGFLISIVSVASVKLSDQASAYYFYYYEMLKEKLKEKNRIQGYLDYYPTVYFNKEKLGDFWAKRGILINRSPWYFCLVWLYLLVILFCCI